MSTGDKRVLGIKRSPISFRLALPSIVLAVFVLAAGPAPSQDSELPDRERVMAEKFLEVLKRRPRPGTALDRVYGFHVQNGSLDDFIGSLDVPDDDPDAGGQRMILGLLQSQRGHEGLAAEAFAKAESLLAEDYAASYFLGRSLLAVGQTEKAAAAMERAIDRKPARNEALPIFTELGRLYGRAGQTEKALEVWQKLEALFPGDVRVGGQIANTLAEEGNLEEALNRFETLSKSARKDDEKIAFAVQAAEIRRRMGEPEKCTEALEKILSRLRPGSWLYSDVRSRIEEGFLKSGDYDALADYYKKKLSQSPDDLAMQVRLGRILVSARRLDEAAEILTQAVDRAPDDAEVRLALVDVLVNKGDRAAAAEQFAKLAEQDPDNPDYLLRWGQILLDDEKQQLAERQDAAAEIWQRLADARSDDAVTLSQIADRMRRIDRKDDAIALYGRAIDVDPGSPQYREYLGEYFHQLNRNEDAIKTWQSIAEGDRRSRDSMVRLAEVFGTFKESKRSLDAWREAAEMDLTFPQELRYAQILRDAKRFEDAINRLDAAEEIAETPDEFEQLLKDRIETYQKAGTLSEQIAKLESADPTVDNLRKLAMMHSAAGQLVDAAVAIDQAVRKQPENPNILLVAAEIFERQNRFVDAAEVFQKLATIDTRFQTNYLQRVADLQMRLGQVDQAMETCDSLIDVNPASPESYQFLARLAFRAGRADEGITALRRAMNIAPRDNGPRRMLAATFADRYRTEEAIELYWQAMRYEPKADGRIGLVKQLAPLYDRKGESDELIRRIGDLARDDVDARTVQLMVAAAHESVGDFGAARQAVDQLLASQPRDVSLLEMIVRLSDAADDVVNAAEFQERIVALADTPENRFKLVQLQLDAEIIDIKTALGERISFASDPGRLGSMVQSAIRRGDRSTAIAICEEAVRRDPSLWDVKLKLAQQLLFQDDDSDDADVADDGDSEQEGYPKPHQRAIELAHQIRELKLPLDARPPTAAKPQGSAGNSRVSYNTSPSRWTSSSYTLARSYRLGRYGSSNYSSSTQYNPPDPSSFGHARILATAVEMVAIAKRYPTNESTAKIRELIDQTLSLPPVEEINDANLIWEQRALESLASYVTSTSSSSTPKSKLQQELTERLNWRLAELDPRSGAGYLRGMLIGRARNAANQMAQSKKPKGSSIVQATLDPKQLALVIELYNAAIASQTDGNVSTPASWSTLSDFRTILAVHFDQAGDEVRAQEFALEPPADDASLVEIISAMSYYLTLNQVDQADALVDRLMPAVRQDESGKASSSSSMTGTAGRLMTTGNGGADFVDRHRFQILDAVLAHAIKGSTANQSRTSTLTDGTMNTYVRSSQNSYYSFQVKAPLSTDLLNQQVVAELSSLMPSSEDSSQSRALKIPDEVIAHLDRPLDGASTHEQKSRYVLAAFSYWWTKRPQECYSRLNRLCEQFPDDVDLRIEQARLASELSQPRIALKALDSFDPLDSRMLVRKEMAALNLATQVGDVDRAKQAAERLFGLRMDTKTQLALADQLRRLGMADKAAAVLRRLRGGRARDERTDLQVAQAFLSSGDEEAAAEVAYTVLRRVSSGRGTSNNASYYRQQSVSILKKAKRLAPLIEQAKRRLDSAPASTRARTELAELYSAAGRKDDADKLWDKIAKSKPADSRQLIQRAESFYRSNDYKQAAEMYLAAFEKDPQQLNRYCYQMTRSVERGGDADDMFRRLTKIDAELIPGYRVDEIIRVKNREPYTDAKRRFVAHAMKNSQVKRDFYRYIDDVPADEKRKIPEIRETIIEVICSDEAFAATSNIWRVSSRSSGGRANGPLKEILDLLANDSDARARFVKAANNAKKNDSYQPTAGFLMALHDVADESKRDDAVDTIAELVKLNLDVDRGDSIRISGGLIWQAGQIIETVSNIDEKNALLVAMYEASARDPNVSDTDVRFSVGARLVKVLSDNGQRARARKLLLDAYAKTDHSADDQYNPGYGDYQDIQSYQAIAEKLEEIGFPIDALLIQQRLMASPERFEKANRWSNNLKIEKTEKAAEDVAKKITPETSAEYLKQVGHSLSEVDGELAIKLLELPLDLMLQSAAEPGIQMAIDSAASSAEGMQALEDFAETLRTEASKRPTDWSITATQMLLSIKLQSSDLAELSQTLMDRLPKQDELDAARDTPAATSFRPLIDLVAVVSAGAKSDHEPARQVVNDLSKYLRSVAKTLQDPKLDFAVAAIGGSGGTSLEEFLDAIEENANSETFLSKPQSDACMSIATIAAKRGLVKVSARALQLAMQHGPPMRQIGGNDAFSLNQNQNSQPNQSEDPVDQIAARLLGIIDSYSDAIGHPLGLKEPNQNDDEREASVDQETLQALDRSLRAIVLPVNQPGIVYPYAKRIASRTNYDNYSSRQDLDPQSVSIAMARVAALAGTSEQLFDQLRHRLDGAIDKEAVAGVMVDVAVAWGQPDQLVEALDQFHASVDTLLPSIDSPAGVPDPSGSINQQESYRKSDIVDLMVRTLAPVITSEELTQADSKGRASELFARTTKLIESDSYTSSRHREILRRIKSKVLTAATDQGDQKMVKSVLGSEVEAFRFQLFGFGGVAPARSSKVVDESNLKKLIADGMFANSTKFIRRTAAEGRRKDYESKLAMLVCLESSKLPPQKRYDFLKRLTLGDKNGDSLLHWSGFIAASDAATHDHGTQPDDAVKLPTCTEAVPIADTILMLADVAAELGKSDELAQEFQSRSQQPGDPADVAATIVLLGAAKKGQGDWEWLNPTLDAVAADVAKSKPTRADGSVVFPDLPLYLASRAIAKGFKEERAGKLMQDLQVHATLGQFDSLASIIEKVNAVAKTEGN